MEQIIEAIYSRGNWLWLWKEFYEKKGQNIREAVIKLLTYQSIIINKNGKIERIGLSAYELSNKSKYGTNKSNPRYKRIKNKPSYSNLVTTILPEMRKSFLIYPVTKYTSHSGQNIPIYILTFNGLIFSLCFFNEDYNHTKEIIENHIKILKHYNISDERGTPVTLLRNFLNLSDQEQIKFFEMYFRIINKTNLSENEIKELNKFQWLLISPRLAYFYQFFLLPAFFSKKEDEINLTQKCWKDYEEIFRRSLQLHITNHIKSFDNFQEKLGLPLEENVNIASHVNKKGTGALLFWIGKNSNIQLSDYFLNNHNIPNEKMPIIYKNALFWAINEFLKLINSNKEKDKLLLKKLIESIDIS